MPSLRVRSQDPYRFSESGKQRRGREWHRRPFPFCEASFAVCHVGFGGGQGAPTHKSVQWILFELGSIQQAYTNSLPPSDLITLPVKNLSFIT